jgi:dihydroorotase
MNILIKNATIVNEGIRFNGSVLVKDSKIEKIYKGMEVPPSSAHIKVLDADGKTLIPGVIDDQVHFRDPGLTHKGDIFTESRAAIAGGVTSFMEMPNTKPQTTTISLLEEKNTMAAGKAFANYSFYMGATNDNIKEIEKVNPAITCGVKIFMGSSTGNMLVDKQATLEAIFKGSPVIIATHCEDEETIQANQEKYLARHGENIPLKYHPAIRGEEACYRSSAKAVELASKHGARLHILHLSTGKETGLLDNSLSLAEKKITAEVCVHHLWFHDEDYEKLGPAIKWNPAIKTLDDQKQLMVALKNNKIDVVATDHAPHTAEEKNLQTPSHAINYLKTPSGGPLVQHSLVAMLEFYHQKFLSLETIVEKMCHAPAQLFRVKERGYIREGYQADLVLLDVNQPWTVGKDNILYKCGWSPFEGTTFQSRVTHTFVNGNLVYENGRFMEEPKGERILFDR